MSFTRDWLALREPADRAARDAGLKRRLAAWAEDRPLLVADLGCGTGATFRALAPLLPGARWLLIDDDPALLKEAARRTGAETARADLARDLGALAEADLVTASAFVDLCSDDWIARFADALPAHAAVYAALTYDGEEVWRPPHPAEPRALAALHEHMRTDKGFGPALGPDAPDRLAEVLAARGRRVETAASPWRLDASDRELIEELARGAAKAVEETGALKRAELAAWHASRAAADEVVIGHVDLLALPGEADG